MELDDKIKAILAQKDQRISELEKENARIGNDLAGTFFETIELMGSVTTFTERYYEGNHGRFVAEKVESVAKLLGVKEHLRFQIRIAGLLAGLGKISFKDSNLFKFPHEMTKSEFDQFKLYPRISVEILKHHSGFESILPIILQHTEHLDGSGFPHGLKGDDIHPGAKILCVVDTYHNLVYKKHRETQRSDKKNAAFTNTQSLLAASKDRHTSAIKYLQQRKGSWYDARVVDAFAIMIEHERSDLSDKQILRVPVNRIEPAMIFAQDYHSSYGLLIASRGEAVTEEMIKPLIRFAEAEEIPHKLLMLA